MLKMEGRGNNVGMLKVTECELEGLKIIEPQVFADDRGWFMESYRKEDYEKADICCEFVQDNRAYSKKGVLRGLHFQVKYPQDKLLSVLRGEIYDVAVDIRKDSKTYGKWFGIRLSDKNKKQVFITKGFAHGYLVLSEEAEILYKCSEIYHPEDEGGIAWDDPKLAIQWPISAQRELIISEKDRNWEGLL